MRIDNALDHDYDTFGTYGEADEVLEDIYPQIDSPYFIGVGHPRMLSVNAQYTF
jgi:iron complex outermembrane receptor protein